MIEIKLKNGQTGYDVVGEYIRRYWKNNSYTDVIVCMDISDDGNEYYTYNEVATPAENFDDVMFLHDWWEGEEYIKLFGIKSIDDIDISGGIYE